MSKTSYYLRLLGLLQRFMRVSHTQSYHFSLRQRLSLSGYWTLFLLRSGKQVEMNEVKIEKAKQSMGIVMFGEMIGSIVFTFIFCAGGFLVYRTL